MSDFRQMTNSALSGVMIIENEVDNTPRGFVGGGGKTGNAVTPYFNLKSEIRIPINGPTDTAGALGGWQNNTGVTLLCSLGRLYVTTQSAGACTVSAGVAANATTLNAGLVSGASVAATGIFQPSGTLIQTLAPGSWLTVSTASGASSGLIGDFRCDITAA